MSDTPTAPVATIRWIDTDNADGLGYDEAGYAEGQWVVEDGEGVWRADLSASLRETDSLDAQVAAEQLLNPRGDLAWRILPANYGTAYELVPELTLGDLRALLIDVGPAAGGLGPDPNLKEPAMDTTSLLAAHRAELARKIELMARELDYAAGQLRRHAAELADSDPVRRRVASIVGDAVATATKAGGDVGSHLRGLVGELVQHEHSAADVSPAATVGGPLTRRIAKGAP